VVLMFEDEVVEVERVCKATAENVSSMLQDVREGRRTEVDSITGVVVEKGRGAGVATPANERLLASLKG
jgi:2-dehydropantoate 2-reductase